MCDEAISLFICSLDLFCIGLHLFQYLNCSNLRTIDIFIMCELTVHGCIKGFPTTGGGRGCNLSLQRFLVDNAFQYGKMIMQKELGHFRQHKRTKSQHPCEISAGWRARYVLLIYISIYIPEGDSQRL